MIDKLIFTLWWVIRLPIAWAMVVIGDTVELVGEFCDNVYRVWNE